MGEFFLGIRLPKGLEETCERYRRAFKAPKTVAHITVIAPFTWQEAPEDLVELIRIGLRSGGPFTVQGQGLGSFDSRVLFINVTLSRELQTMQKVLADSLAQQGVSLDRRPYRPHITLATRLTTNEFTLYQEQLAGFSPKYSFSCREITIFQLNRDRRWAEWARLPLGT